MRKKATRVFIAGHNGMVGSAICRLLEQDKNIDLIYSDRKVLNLTNQASVDEFFSKNKFDQVYLAAAKVGGIHANNTQPADFIYQNLMIQSNVIHAAYQHGVKKLLFLGSSCIYPKETKQPMSENALLTGYLEPTNEPYAIAKIAGIKLCESYNRQYKVDYRSIMPTNLYGPNDNFHPENSHVIPALIRRFHEAKHANAPEVVVWGSGHQKREFLHVDDMAKASVFIMNLDSAIYQKNVEPMQSHINVGTAQDCTIRALVTAIADVIGYKGKVRYDTNKPDGAPRKLLDNSLINSLGWKAEISLKIGLENTYAWFLANLNNYKE